jgi:hypothetical protein
MVSSNHEGSHGGKLAAEQARSSERESAMKSLGSGPRHISASCSEFVADSGRLQAFVTCQLLIDSLPLGRMGPWRPKLPMVTRTARP